MYTQNNNTWTCNLDNYAQRRNFKNNNCHKNWVKYLTTVMCRIKQLDIGMSQPEFSYTQMRGGQYFQS